MKGVTSPRRGLLLCAVGVLVLQHLVPFGRLVLYPFTLLATWVHEMGHGLTALATGGKFAELEIFANAAGLAHTYARSNVVVGLVALGGLVAPPLVGAAILALARGPRRGRLVLVALAAALVVSLALWVRSPAGLISMPLVALFLALVAWRGRPRDRQLLAQLVGLLLAVDTVTRIDYVFTSSVAIDGIRRPSDIAAVAQALGGPQLGWSLLVALVSLGACALGLWAAWRAPRSAATAPGAGTPAAATLGTLHRGGRRGLE
jgi:peptidase M50B-like protein